MDLFTARFLDATSLVILLPTSVLLAIFVCAYRKRLRAAAVPYIESPPAHNVPPELEIYDPPLTEIEFKFVNGNHNIQLHNRRSLQMVWLSCVVFELSVVSLRLAETEIALLMAPIAAFLLVFSTAWFFFTLGKKCNCGATRILSEKARLKLIWDARSSSNFSVRREFVRVALTLTVVAAAGALSLGGVLLCSKILFLFLPSPRVMLAAALLFPTLILASIGITTLFVDPRKHFLTLEEVHRVTSLRGNTIEELDEMIAFYKRIGNFKKTDEYSRRLIELSEQS